MPSTIQDLLNQCGLKHGGSVRWGSQISEFNSGVYIISLNKSPIGINGTLEKAPVDKKVCSHWLEICPQLQMDGIRPTVQQLMDRLNDFWLPDEVVLYIGKATTLSSRIRQYYKTPVGAPWPHSGGYFLKLLSNLDELWVHYAISNQPEKIESQMIQFFTENVSKQTKHQLRDPYRPFPFANLEWPRGTRKAHGLTGTRNRKTRNEKGHGLPISAQCISKPLKTKPRNMDEYRTQRITAKDIDGGRIRIPSTNTADTKSILPSEKTRINVMLKDRQFTNCAWDPKMGPDRQRSGVIRIGSELGDYVEPDEILRVEVGEDGMVIIE